MRQHYCGDSWRDGPVASCDRHEKNLNRRAMRWGRKTRAKMDREAGVVGTDRGGFISGNDSGR